MTQHRIPSTWLQNPSDEQMIQKAAAPGRMGSIITGDAPLIQRLAKAAETVLVCKSGHEVILAKAEGERCARKDCRAPLMVKGAPEDETEAVQVRTVKSDDTPTGGSIDGQPIMTSKSRVRRPWTGTR